MDKEIVEKLETIRKVVAPTKEERELIKGQIFNIIKESGEEGVTHRDLTRLHDFNPSIVTYSVTILKEEGLIFPYFTARSTRLWKAMEELVETDNPTKDKSEKLGLLEYAILKTIALAQSEDEKIITSMIVSQVPATSRNICAALKSTKEKGFIAPHKVGRQTVWTLADGFIEEN